MKKPKYPRIPERLRLNQKLSENDRALIRFYRRQGYEILQIAIKFDVCRATIQWWLATPEQRKRWASTHIDRSPKQSQYDATNRCHKRRQEIMPKAQKRWYRNYSRYLKAEGLKSG